MNKYETLSKQLAELISRNLKQGITALPTEAAIAGQYQVSRQTVRAALSLLKTRGWSKPARAVVPMQQACPPTPPAMSSPY